MCENQTRHLSVLSFDTLFLYGSTTNVWHHLWKTGEGSTAWVCSGAPHELQGFDHHAVCSVVLRPHRMHASRRFEWQVFVSQDWTIPSSMVCWRFQPLTTWLDNTIRLSNWSTVSIPIRDSKQVHAWRLETNHNQDSVCYDSKSFGPNCCCAIFITQVFFSTVIPSLSPTSMVTSYQGSFGSSKWRP